MSETRGPKPGGKPFAVEQRKVRPRELPRAPEREAADWSFMQVVGAALLVLCGMAVVAFFALGLPLSAVGGPAVLIVPLMGAAFFMRRGGRR